MSQCHPAQLRAVGTAMVRHLLQVPQNGSVAEQGAEQCGARAPGWRPASWAGAPLPGLVTGCCLQVTVSAAGDAETGKAGAGRRATSRHSTRGPSTFPGLRAGASTPPPAWAMHVERGWGSGDFTPRHRCGAEAQQKRPGRLGYCPVPPAPLTSQPRPLTGLDPTLTIQAER